MASSTPLSVSVVVAIPVRNERAHIGACLGALDAQRNLRGTRLGVLLLLNNCTDGTEAIVQTLSPFGFALRTIVREHAEATAGWARRQAMEAGATWLEESATDDGVLLTTDADSRVPPDWIARNLSALAADADAVAGRLQLDPADAALLPSALHSRGALEAEYETLLAEITARLAPVRGNPWPHHWCRSGASLAVRLSTYRAIGGMPEIPLGEDRAFVEAVLAHDLVVRHDPELVIVTSGRLQGRATGGVADTIRHRCNEPQSVCDERLETLNRAVGRALLRRCLRWLYRGGRVFAIQAVARALRLDPASALQAAQEPTFGRLHALIETLSPHLAYRPLRPSELPSQIARARFAARVLRRASVLRGSFSRVGVTGGIAPVSRDVSRGTAVVEACD